MSYCVYMHTCPNGKRYVGITSRNPKYRWLSDGKGYADNKHFYSAIVKYGWINIKHEILFDGLTKEDACAKERELIAQYNSNNPKYGYNQSSGGESGGYGIKQSQLTIAKRIAKTKGQKRTPEQIKRISEAHKGIAGKKGSDNPKTKKVLCVELNTIYAFSQEASNVLKINKSHICDCCVGRRKRAGGYHWQYV